MAPKSRTPETLRKVSKHLYYEVWMLEALAQILATGQLGKNASGNAAIEAFAIHVRAVMDFLYADSPRPDDVVAEDFLPQDTNWSEVRPPLTKVLKVARKRAGKEVAHLTYARLNVSPEEKLWHFLDIAQDVSLAFKVFLQHVPPENLDDDWRDGVPA